MDTNDSVPKPELTPKQRQELGRLLLIAQIAEGWISARYRGLPRTRETQDYTNG
jgi:hypothetical protein